MDNQIVNNRKEIEAHKKRSYTMKKQKKNS